MKNRRCKYFIPSGFLPETGYSCPHLIDEAHPKHEFCIFHLPKPSEESADALAIQELFNARISTLMENMQSGTADFLDFRGFYFPDVTWDGELLASADFSHAVFTHDVEFSMEVASTGFDDDTFGDFTFAEGIRFVNARFIGEAIFSHVTFRSHADFRSATFEKDVVFNGALFESDTHFDTVKFKGNANFSGAHFKKFGQFEHASFTQKADFDSSRFDLGATFEKTVFHAEADFDEALFGEGRYSSESNEPLDDEQERIFVAFWGCTFTGKASFEDTFFNCDVHFQSAVFKNEARFIANRNFLFNGDCYFSGVSLHKDADLVFFRVNLSRARFHDTNIELINFRDVQWASAQTKLGKLLRGDAYILWDEINPLDEMRYHAHDDRTAENYRQLVLNYESKRDYESAEYFHIGEMEMRRRSKGNRTAFARSFPFSRTNLRAYINGHGLYWLSSRYGTSYTQALGVLLVMVLCFSLLFLYAGFQRVREGADNSIYTIEYNLLPDNVHHSVSASQWASDFGESISFTLSILTFQRDRFYQPLNAVSRFVLFLSVFLLAAQAALTLLAIRRRFRR